MAKQNSSSSDPAHVTFRITNPAVAEELAVKAAARGCSTNLFARELVVEGLIRPDEIRASVDQLNGKIDQLARKLSQLDIIQLRLERGIYLLFRHAGKLDADQTKALMTRFFTSSVGSNGG